MDMDSSEAVDDLMPTFCIGQHESKRPLPVTPHTVRQAHDCNVSELQISFHIFADLW